ncbi:hypothetical protein GCM10027615_52490 [Plantactinospora veratri]
MPTVSRVLNGRNDVAPQTRERVEELLRRHGYRRRATRPRAGASLIDLIFNDLDSPWAVEIIRGVEDVAHASGVGTVVSAIHRRSTSTRQWLQNLRTRATDGVILVASDLAPPVHAELRRLNVPMVLVDPAGVPNLDIPTIGATNWAGGLRATEHLLSLGHRRIGFIAGPPRLLCSRARLDGYRAALDAAGIRSATSWSCRATSTTSPATPAGPHCSTSTSRRRRSSPPATRWRSGRTRRSGGGVCGSPTT